MLRLPARHEAAGAEPYGVDPGVAHRELEHRAGRAHGGADDVGKLIGVVLLVRALVVVHHVHGATAIAHEQVIVVLVVLVRVDPGAAAGHAHGAVNDVLGLLAARIEPEFVRIRAGELGSGRGRDEQQRKGERAHEGLRNPGESSTCC